MSDINQPDPVHKAASLAAWGALRQRHYATVDEVFDALASDVLAAVRPLIEAEVLRKAADSLPDYPTDDAGALRDYIADELYLWANRIERGGV